VGQLVVDRLHEVNAAGVRVQPVCSHRERLRIAVDTDQGERGMGVEQRSRVTTETHRGIEHHGWPIRQRGLEQLQAPAQQHGGVLRGPGVPERVIGHRQPPSVHTHFLLAHMTKIAGAA
jgi:hypothetical protein